MLLLWISFICLMRENWDPEWQIQNDCSVTHSPDVVCGRFIFSFLVRLDSQLESCQESRRTPFDISPLTPAKEKTQFMAFLKVYWRHLRLNPQFIYLAYEKLFFNVRVLYKPKVNMLLLVLLHYIESEPITFLRQTERRFPYLSLIRLWSDWHSKDESRWVLCYPKKQVFPPKKQEKQQQH